MTFFLVPLTVVASIVGIAVFVKMVQNKAEERGIWVGEFNADRESFKSFMMEVRAKLDQIFERLPRQPVVSESPLKLSDFGREISEQVNGKAWAESQAQRIIDDFREMHEYEIQERCLSHVWDQFNGDQEMNTVFYRCAYDSGLKVDQVVEVVSIELRDAVLSSRGKILP